MIKTVTFYEVYDDYSEDGRVPNIRVIGTFSTETVAISYAQKKGNYGADAQVREKIIYICETIDDIKTLKKEQFLRDTLKKLNDAEFEVIKDYISNST